MFDFDWLCLTFDVFFGSWLHVLTRLSIGVELFCHWTWQRKSGWGRGFLETRGWREQLKPNVEKINYVSNIIKFLNREANKEYATHLGVRRHINNFFGRSKLAMWIDHRPWSVTFFQTLGACIKSNQSPTKIPPSFKFRIYLAFVLLVLIGVQKNNVILGHM